MADYLLELEVKLNADRVMDRFEKRALSAARKIERDLEKALQSVNKNIIRVNVDSRQLQSAASHAATLGKSIQAVNADLRLMNSELAKAERIMASIGLKKLKTGGGGASGGGASAASSAQKEAEAIFRTNAALTRQRVSEAQQAERLIAAAARQSAKEQANAQRELRRQQAADAKARQSEAAMVGKLNKDLLAAKGRSVGQSGDREMQRSIALQREMLRHAQQLAKIKASPISPDAAKNAQNLAHALNSINLDRINKQFDGLNKNIAKGSGAPGIGAGVAAGVSSAVTSFGLSAAGAAVAAPIAFTEDSIQKGMDFNAALSMLQINTSATDAEMKKIRETVLNTSRAFGAAPVSVAELSLELGRMGVTAQQMPDFLTAVGSAARASGEDFDTVKDIIAQTRSVYNDLSVAKIGDLLTVGANISPAGFQAIGQGLSFVAGSAKDADVPLDTLIKQLVILQKAGFRDDRAGTSLNALYTDIKENAGVFEELGVAVYESTGKIREIDQIIIDTQGKLKGLSDAQKSAFFKPLDTNSGRALRALGQAYSTAAEEVKGFESQLKKADGVSASQSAKAMQDAKARLAVLSAKTDELGIKLYDALAPAIGGVGEFGGALIDALLESDGLLTEITNASKEFADYLSENPQIVQQIADGLKDAAEVLSNQLGTEAKQLVEYLKENPKAIGDAVTGMGEFARNMATVVSAAAELVSLLAKVAEISSKIPDIPGMARGAGVNAGAAVGAGLQNSLRGTATQLPVRQSSGALDSSPRQDIRQSTGSLDMSSNPIKGADQFASGDEDSLEVTVAYKPGTGKSTRGVAQSQSDKKNVMIPRSVNFSTNAEVDGGAEAIDVNDPKVREALQYFLSIGYSMRGAATMVGNLLQESNLDPGAVGDNGTAFGLSQWRFDRREGMPSDFRGQLEFVNEEYERDTPGSTEAFYGNDESAMRRSIRDVVRYGHEGSRFEYGQQLYDQMQDGSWESGSSSRSRRSSRSDTPPPPRRVEPVGVRTASGQDYGASRDGGDRAHDGEDFDLQPGQASRTYLGGEVVGIEDWGAMGQAAVIFNEALNATEVIAEWTNGLVRIGDRLAAGDAVGTGADELTGVSHVEIHQGRGRTGDTVSPLDFYESVGVDPGKGIVYNDGKGADDRSSEANKFLQQARDNLSEAERLRRETEDKQFASETDAGKLQIETQNQGLTGTRFEQSGRQRLDTYERNRQYLDDQRQGERDLLDLQRERQRLDMSQPNADKVAAAMDAAIAQQQQYLQSLKANYDQTLANTNAASQAAAAQEDMASRQEMAQRNTDQSLQNLNAEVQLFIGSFKDADLGALEQLGRDGANALGAIANQADEVRTEISQIEEEIAKAQAAGVPLNDPAMVTAIDRVATLRDLLGQIEKSSEIQLSINTQDVDRAVESFRRMQDERLTQSRASIMRANGDNFGATQLEEQSATAAEVTRYTDRVRDIQGSTVLTDDQKFSALASEAENYELALYSIDQQYQSIGETAAATAKEMVGGFARSLLAGEDFGQSLLSMLDGIIAKLGEMVINQAIVGLFGNGLTGGLFGGGGAASGAGLAVQGIGAAFGITPTLYMGSVPNYADGNIENALRREQAMSGRRSYLAAINEDELVLSASQSKKFMDYDLQSVVNMAGGNLPPVGNTIAGMSASINVPLTIVAGEGQTNNAEFRQFAQSVQRDMKALADSRLIAAQRPGGLLARRQR